MPIYKGLTKIESINKGTTPIANVYKGAVLVYSSAKWLSYGFTNLYNSLIPTTIQSRNVLDKLRISKVYGNSVVENQLVQNGNFTSDSGWAGSSTSALSVNNSVLSFTVNASYGYVRTLVNINNNHKYLALATIKLTTGTTNVRVQLATSGGTNIDSATTISTTSAQKIVFIASSTITDNQALLRIRDERTSNWDEIQVKDVMLFDLTQMFPFDTPTTLTDVRVQALLNRGYIEYNTGEIKSVDISEFSSKSFNIWDEEWVVGNWTSSGTIGTATDRIRNVNLIRVQPNTTYYFKCPSNGNIICYDENGTFIPTSEYSWQYAPSINANSSFTTPKNCHFINFNTVSNYGTVYKNDVCINVSSSLNGTYKPHQTFSPLPFIYQGSGVGSVHDTFEITKTEYEFVRNVWRQDLSSLTWALAYSGDNAFWYSPINNYKYLSSNSNTICDKYFGANISSTSTDIGYLIISSGTLRIRNGSSTITPIGNLNYELATPQTIRIPKRHLGVVDLGSFNWQYNSSIPWFYITINNIKPESSNLYCSKYKTTTYGIAVDDKCIKMSSGKTVVIKDTDYTDATAFKNAMSGVYLFYETESEVVDIETQIEIEAGGTITSDSNVLPNVDTVIKCK